MPKREPFQVNCDNVQDLSALEKSITESSQQVMVYYFQKILNSKTVDFDNASVQDTLLKIFNGIFTRHGMLAVEIDAFDLDEIQSMLDDWHDPSIDDPLKQYTQQMRLWIRHGFFTAPENKQDKIRNCLFDWYKHVFYYGYATTCILGEIEKVVEEYYQHHTQKPLDDPNTLVMFLSFGIEDKFSDPNHHIINRMLTLDRSLRSSCKFLLSGDGVDQFWWSRVHNTKPIAKLIDETELDKTTRRTLYTLITRLIYQDKRNKDLQHEGSIKTRKQINVLCPGLGSYSITKFAEFITAKETALNTYFGDNLSDNSDSEDEERFQQKDNTEKQAVNRQAQTYIRKAQPSNLFVRNNAANALKANRPAPSSIFNIPERQAIPYLDDDISDEQRRKLNRINEQLAAGIDINAIDIDLRRDFYVLQVRGIIYLTNKWNQATRQAHRKLDERFAPQYAASVWKEADSTTTSLVATSQPSAEEYETLDKLALLLRHKLLEMRTVTGVAVEGYLAPNLAIGVQLLYSRKYDDFHAFIQRDERVKKYLINDANPFLSTADTPYHALRYAYGVKPYQGHEEKRLRPRWRRDGTPERPYSGKIYCSLHPLTDYDNNGPYHNVTLQWRGDMNLDNLTIAERESSFYAKIDKDRVFMQHLAKYPALKQYKQIYLHKYGLTEDLFNAFKNALLSAPPHSIQRKNIKWLLGEWLCAYHEVKILHEAKQYAAAQGKLLVYRDYKGGFSFDLPIDSPTRNGVADDVKTPIKERRQLRTSLSPQNDSTQTTEVDYETALAKMDELGIDDVGELGLLNLPRKP